MEPYTPYLGVNSLRINKQDDQLNKVIGSNLGTSANALYTGDQVAADLAKNDITNPATYAPSGMTLSGLTPGATTDEPWYAKFSKDSGALGAAGVGLGIGQLGLGLANYFDAADTSKLNRQLMNQQIANNKVTMADREANKAAMEKVFAPRAPGGGLAQLATSRGV